MERRRRDGGEVTRKWARCLDAMKAIQQEMMGDSKGLSEWSTKNALRNGSSIKEHAELPWRVPWRIWNSFRRECRHFCICGKVDFPNKSPQIENSLLGMCLILITTEITFSKPFKKETTSSWRSLYKLFCFLRRYMKPQRSPERDILFYLHPEFHWVAPEIDPSTRARIKVNWCLPHPTGPFQSSCCTNLLCKYTQYCDLLLLRARAPPSGWKTH